jgi:hypothetical protein
MSALLVQRLLALAAAGLLAIVIGLAVASRGDEVAGAGTTLPRPAVSSLSGWYAALAGVRGRPLAGKVSGCGTLLSPRTLGVDHPVLPCGAKIFVAFGGKIVLTTVVDRGPFTPRPDFEVTPALGDLLRLRGVQQIRWSFARAA